MENKIEGGSACKPETVFDPNANEYCEGTGRSPKRIFRGGVMVRRKGDACYHCGGTGVKPLDKWTADECADYIYRSAKPTPGINLQSRSARINARAAIEEALDLYEASQLSSNPLTLTEALRAAVAKERK